MADMGFRVEEVRGVQVVVAPEEIDIINADGLRVALLEAAAHGHGTLVADMTRTRFCDSAGLNALVAAHNRARAEDGRVLLAISCAAVLRVFAITGVDRVIPNFVSLDEALDVALGQDPRTDQTRMPLSTGSLQHAGIHRDRGADPSRGPPPKAAASCAYAR